MEFNIHEMAIESQKDSEEIIRMIRNNLLSDSDWTQVFDSPLTETKREEWKLWRQYLRDLPTQFIGLEHYPEVLLINDHP